VNAQPLETPKCRFCGADASVQSVKGATVYGGRPEHKFWQCHSCQMIYLYPPLSEEEETFFYKKEFEKYMARRGARDKDWSSPENHFQSNQGEMLRRMRFLETYLRPKQHILEIGCSSGFMLHALNKHNRSVVGIDPSEGFIEFIRSKGIPVYKDIEELTRNHSQAFDLIIHYYVFEHIRNPKSFIKTYMGLLKENGQMIFEVPCATDPLIELYQVPAFDRFYWSVAHHWYFNKNSLGRLLDQTRYKYELFPEQRYDLSNHMVWMLEGKPGGYGKYSELFGQELENLYKERLKRNWLCDTIIALLQN
jgi:SAM-dependent methyltransferase